MLPENAKRFPEQNNFAQVRFSKEFITAMHSAEASRSRLSHRILGVEHMLIGGMQAPAGHSIFEDLFNCDIDPIGVIEKHIAETMEGEDEEVKKATATSEEAKEAIQIASAEATRDGSLEITDKHLLKGVMRTSKNTAAKILDGMGIDTAQIMNRLNSPRA